MFINLGLSNERELVFDGLLQRHDIAMERLHVVQEGIECGGFPRSRGACRKSPVLEVLGNLFEKP